MEVKVHESSRKIVMPVMSCLVFRGGLRGGDSYLVRIRVLTPIVFNGPR